MSKAFNITTFANATRIIAHNMRILIRRHEDKSDTNPHGTNFIQIKRLWGEKKEKVCFNHVIKKDRLVISEASLSDDATMFLQIALTEELRRRGIIKPRTQETEDLPPLTPPQIKGIAAINAMKELQDEFAPLNRNKLKREFCDWHEDSNYKIKEPMEALIQYIYELMGTKFAEQITKQ